MIFRLDDRLLFPDAALAEQDGLLAVGGDLSVDRLLSAYKNGIFPWYGDDTPIMWYSPHERFVLYPHQLKISKTMQKVMRRGVFEIRINTAFDAVIEACSTSLRKDQDGTWITREMKQAYTELHQQGYAHAYEAWQNGQLVGGLYGVAAGNVFCGESMFSKVSNASKAALIALCQSGLYSLIDCQVYTEHLESLGAKMISREAYLDMLKVK